MKPQIKEATLEIEIHKGTKSKVSYDIFRSWTGKRWINGTEYRGPAFYFLSQEIARPLKRVACAFLLLATMATNVRAIDPPNVGQLAPAAWTRETEPKPRADFVAQWRIDYANDFNGPWMPAPVVLEGRFSAGFMNEFIHFLLQEEMENHTTGNTSLKFLRFVQVGD